MSFVPATKPNGGWKLAELEETFGVLFIGYIVAMVLYGFTFFQSYVYFSRYPKDAWSIKASVGVLWAIDSTTSALMSQVVYYYLVTQFPTPSELTYSTLNFCVEIALVVVSIVIVQLMYTYRIWQLSKSIVLSGAVAVLSLAGFGCGIAMVLHMFQNKSFASLEEGNIKIIVSLCQGFTALAAAFIMGCMAYFKTSIRNSESKLEEDWFDKFVAFTISGGAAVFAVQVVYLVLFVALPHKLYWMPAHLVGSKMFILSILTLLNSREVHNGLGSFDEKSTSALRRRSTRVAFTSSSASRSHPGEVASPNKVPINIEILRTVEQHSSTAKGGYESEDGRSENTYSSKH
jgi:hypothetical protein